jgi:hypothetical protein
MPSDVRNYAESIQSDVLRVEQSVIREGAAARPTGMAGLVAGGMAVAAVGAGMVL